MENNIILLTSITYAHKAQQLLRSYRISSQIVRTPKELNGCGCGYSLTGNFNKKDVIEILQTAGIKLSDKNFS
jgi:hypothetical protein